MSVHDERDSRWTGVVIGLVIVGLGLILLFDQTGLLGWRSSRSIWPMLIIALGLARFAQPRADRSRGGWLILVGVLLLLNEMRMLRFRDSWPLILVALGVLKMWKAVRPTRTGRAQGQSS